jgi:hypothetical protein
MTTTTLPLTVGAADLLAQLSAAPGLLTAPGHLMAVGLFAEAHLADLPPKPADANDVAAWRAWDREPMPPVEIKPKTLEALRVLVKAATEKGYLPARPATVRLLAALDLGGE